MTLYFDLIKGTCLQMGFRAFFLGVGINTMGVWRVAAGGGVSSHGDYDERKKEIIISPLLFLRGLSILVARATRCGFRGFASAIVEATSSCFVRHFYILLIKGHISSSVL